MKSSHNAFTRINAYLSKGVFCKLTIINFCFFPTIYGTSAAGVTVSELPIAKHKSAAYPSSNDLLISYSGKFSPKFIIESWSVPPHFSHFLEVAWSWTFLAYLVLKSLKNWLLHFLHFSKHRLPCNYANFAGLNPDLTWSPSVFWETKNFRSPHFSNAKSAIWVYEGTAHFISTIFLFGASLTFWAFFYQAPGPVLRTVLTPDLKSGIPQAVEIPAPVNAMKWLLLSIN